MDFKQYWNQILEKQEELNSQLSSYWSSFSDMGNWQFWVVTSLLVVPLLLVFFIVDRKRIFEIFFFGYTVHMIWTYIDIALGRTGHFTHKYFLTPVLPNALNITVSVLPVGFLLLYQYCTNKNKNFYLYTLLLSAMFAFGFATIEKYMGFVEFRKGTNQFHLFIIDVGIAYIAYWFTRLLLKVREKNNNWNRELNINNPFKKKAR
ncbi:hypothetical protein P5G65_02210 [Paenibacillus chondroitinus]|uniref:Uncharacterized protein n=1 Tax=Paenibacillus chondroitinus TaxID=59842 RepID=A0ABU6D5H6_9BACL|nr:MULTISPECIES: hypothetical protein [Paenibacillus]MCY9658306.1 hypothetical protein [Paenibacillus anseongense]MEB4792695.1 hypothetical protein [Paenibacillus chondroitinus]